MKRMHEDAFEDAFMDQDDHQLQPAASWGSVVDTTVSGPRRPLREDACRLEDVVGAEGGEIKTPCGAGEEFSTSGAGAAHCRNWSEALHQRRRCNDHSRSWCIWRQSYDRIGAIAMYSATGAGAAYTEIAGTV